jgi:hypothetical protein
VWVVTWTEGTSNFRCIFHSWRGAYEWGRTMGRRWGRSRVVSASTWDKELVAAELRTSLWDARDDRPWQVNVMAAMDPLRTDPDPHATWEDA